jgi:hypothetical protein
MKEIGGGGGDDDDDDVPGNICKLLRECGLKIVTQLFNNK